MKWFLILFLAGASMFVDKFAYPNDSTLDQSGKWGAGASACHVLYGAGSLNLVHLHSPVTSAKAIYGRSIKHANHMVRITTNWGAWSSPPNKCGVVFRSNEDGTTHYFASLAINYTAQGADWAYGYVDLNIGRCWGGNESVLRSERTVFYFSRSGLSQMGLELEASVCGQLIAVRWRYINAQYEQFNTTWGDYVYVSDTTITSGGYGGLTLEGSGSISRWQQTCSDDLVYLVVDADENLYATTELDAGQNEVFSVVHGALDFSAYSTTDFKDGVTLVGVRTSPPAGYGDWYGDDFGYWHG